ncbi:MAG: carbohydrate-binding domain-containing protein, partial [Clostridia bacterium]|nr:carbohydrate-binding domain-containing protein [Clostridia bacterium]
TGGNIVINTGLCGIKAISVSLKDMTLSISSECDGIVAEDVTIDNSTCTITTTGSFTRDDSNGIFKYDNGKYSRFLKSDLGKIAQKYKLVFSAKGISAKNNLTILSGDIDISSVDVALYSEDMLYIFGGNINIVSECQGIESDIIIQIGYKDALELTPNFTINIASSYIGLKASYIECYDGITMAYSYSDGVSIIKSPSNNNYLFIENQARLYVSSEEDGVDVVGDITLNGGSLIIYAGNTNESMAVRYTKNFYYLKGELLNIGFASMLPTKQLSSAKLVGFSLDSASSSRCARNTYLMLYETPAVAPASAEENVFSKVMYLGVRNYIKGMTIIYGMDDMVIGSTYSLRYASGEYAGGTTPTHLPFICEGGNYNINRCYTITGVALDEGVTSVLFGKHINVLGDIEGTIINKFKTLTESIENADYTLTSIDKGAVVKNETPAPSPDGNEEE